VHEVHLAPRPLGEAPELGELLRQPVQPLGLGANDFHCHVRPPFHRTARPSQLVYRDPHGGERILDLVRDAARHLAERPQALRLELALPRGAPASPSWRAAPGAPGTPPARARRGGSCPFDPPSGVPTPSSPRALLAPPPTVLPFARRAPSPRRPRRSAQRSGPLGSRRSAGGRGGAYLTGQSRALVLV